MRYTYISSDYHYYLFFKKPNILCVGSIINEAHIYRYLSIYVVLIGMPIAQYIVQYFCEWIFEGLSAGLTECRNDAAVILEFE